MTVAVLQAGSWGTTLATILARDGGKDVILWTRDDLHAREIAAHRENRRYLPGIRVPDSVTVTADLERAMSADDVIVTAPSLGVRALRDRVAPLLGTRHRLLSATKGLNEDGRRMSQLWAEALAPDRVAVLSGPNISREIAAGLPAPTVVASVEPATARHFQELVGTRMFRPYTNVDVVGVELCGALKNIVALGAGAIDGMGYGENAKAGFVTRGLAEIARYGFTEGANPLTVAGLAGFGDLVATSSSRVASRSRRSPSASAVRSPEASRRRERPTSRRSARAWRCRSPSRRTSSSRRESRSARRCATSWSGSAARRWRGRSRRSRGSSRRSPRPSAKRPLRARETS